MLCAVSLMLVALLAAPAALAIDSGDILVVSSSGEVHISTNGAARKVRVGGALELPATVRTGPDGAIELSQGATTVKLGPETVLEFPALEKRGGPIDRIIQPRGNAFYDIGKREGRRLRVETPYLVGVVKGTQFHVAAHAETATISLFEGLLEIRTADDGAAIDLKAGEIASRRRGDVTIGVTRMDAERMPGTALERSDAKPADEPDALVMDVPSAANSLVGQSATDRLLSTVSPTSLVTDEVVSAPVEELNGATPDVSAEAEIGPGLDAIETEIVADVDQPGTAADVAGPVTVDVDDGITVDAGEGGGAVDISHDVAVDNGHVSVDVGNDISVDAGPGGAVVDISHDVEVDAGRAPVDVGNDISIDAGPGGGAVDVGADAVVDTGIVNTPVGVDTAVDVGTGTVDLGVNAGGLDVDLGLDLGLGEDDSETDSSNTPPTDPGNDGTIDVGGLLEGLLRRPSRQ